MQLSCVRLLYPVSAVAEVAVAEHNDLGARKGGFSAAPRQEALIQHTDCRFAESVASASERRNIVSGNQRVGSAVFAHQSHNRIGGYGLERTSRWEMFPGLNSFRCLRLTLYRRSIEAVH